MVGHQQKSQGCPAEAAKVLVEPADEETGDDAVDGQNIDRPST